MKCQNPHVITSSELIDQKSASRFLRIAGFSLLFLSIYILHLASRWWVFRSTGIYGGKFFDLESVVNSAECFSKQGIGIYQYDPDEQCATGYMYGILLVYVIQLGHFLVGSTTSLAYLGLVLFSVLLGVVAELSWNGSIKTFLLILLFLSSPGPWLLIERGNADVIVVFLLVLAAWFMSRKNFKISFFILASTSFLKFYTYPLLLLVSHFMPTRKQKTAYIISAIILLPLLTWNISLVHGFPNSWFVSFGAPVIPKYPETLDIHIPQLFSYIIGFSSVLITYTVFVRNKTVGKKVHLNWVMNPLASFKESLTFLSGCTFLICYFGGTNYDYRLTFLSLWAVGTLITNEKSEYVSKGLITLILAALWMSDFFPFIGINYFFGIWQFCGDVAILILVTILLHQPLTIVSKMINRIITR